MRILLQIHVASVFYMLLFCKCHADPEEPPCFMVTSASCAELTAGNKCQLSKDHAQIFCCNVTKDRELDGFFRTGVPFPDQILGFHMRDSLFEKLEISFFDRLKKLASFSITNSNITHINGAFDGPSSLTCLNISDNAITEMHPFVLLKLKGLKNIVITNNTNLSMLPEFSKELRDFKLDVSGNLQLSCKYLINLTLAVAQDNMKFILNNRNLTTCLPPASKVFTESSAVYVKMEHLDKVKEIITNCPIITNTSKCHCSVHSLDVGENRTLVYHALVNCAHQAMTSLPKTLPSATRVLDISHNNVLEKITTFDGIGNETFNNIRELYADYNKITSLKPLEGTVFLYQFQNLTLRSNKIDQIQVYMLSNVFDRLQGTRIWLANNEFKCDCQLASTTKLWLIANQEHVPDFYDIYTVCGNTRMRIIDMNQKDLCSNPEEWKDFVRFVIYGEIIVLVSLIGKVSYDCYIFKTFGYLPWPASRMPKLPCDWCFET